MFFCKKDLIYGAREVPLFVVNQGTTDSAYILHFLSIPEIAHVSLIELWLWH